MFPILSQMNSDPNFPHYFPKIHSNIIIPSTSRSSNWSLPFRFPNQNFIYISHLSHVCYMPYPYNPWCDHPNNIWLCIQVLKFLIMQSYPAHHHFLPLRSKYSPKHPVLKIPSIYIPPLLWKTVSHPYKMGKIMFQLHFSHIQVFILHGAIIKIYYIRDSSSSYLHI
jgi:hypothetical protein